MPRIVTMICDDGCGEVITDNTYIEVSFSVYSGGTLGQQQFNLIFKNAQHLLRYLIAKANEPQPILPVGPNVPTPPVQTTSVQVDVRISGTDV